MHLKRILVALIAVPLLYLYITLLPAVFFLVFLAVISALAQHEFHAMYKTGGTMSLLGTIAGVALFASAYFRPDASPERVLVMLLIVVFAVMSSARLFVKKDPSSALKDIAPALVGFLYIPSLLLALWYLRLDGYEWIFLLCLCVWSADTLAFYIGSSIGKRKLYKEVSPNKTVAGAVGSVAGGIIASLLFGSFLIRETGLPARVLIGAVIGAVTILGDLVESMFKRDAGIKDSGSLIPGHGGVLDRIDSLLFAGPALYLLRLII
ncbi:MAG TPA: phosphatidate cytidylyltransferase [Dissulfurispiraceae bacterium]|nr:phosphatidate cytidylyltransferase [Dissulfurispiraceae bacterium]